MQILAERGGGSSVAFIGRGADRKAREQLANTGDGNELLIRRNGLSETVKGELKDQNIKINKIIGIIRRNNYSEETKNEINKYIEYLYNYHAGEPEARLAETDFMECP